MNNLVVLMILRLFHVMAGIFWVGGILIVARFLIPTAQAVGPAAAPFQQHLMGVRKLPMALLAAAWVTVLSGVLLYARNGSVGAGFYASGSGRVFGLGGAFAIIAVLIGTFGNVPTIRRVGAVTAQLQASPGNAELTALLQRLGARMATLTRIVAVLVSLAGACMAVARYVP